MNRREFLELSLVAGGAQVVAGPPAEAAPPARPATAATVTDMTINGRRMSMELDPRTSLVDLLRERLGMFGTKKGCNQGACGACTVLVNQRAVNACLTLAVLCNGAEVTTIEGLARGDVLHPLQEAFIAHDAFQCGHCTPGQILSGVACIAAGHTRSPDEVREHMSGNICRCGAYENIVSAVLEVAGKAKVTP